jgi:hypothetical protein
MKANEAPEKIYIDDFGSELSYDWHTEHSYEKDIEYTRTDAFIEKACDWLKENFLFDEAGYCKTNIYSTQSMIYNFKNTLGGKL